MKTNRPLYFTKDYELTYSDADMPTHYAFIVGSALDSIEREFEQVAKLPPNELLPKPQKGTRKASSSAEKRARSVMAKLDAQGRWIEEGRLKYHGDDDPTTRVIDSRTFVANVRALAAYLATQP